MVASEAGCYNHYFDCARSWVEGKPRKITMGPDRQGHKCHLSFFSVL